MSDYDPEMIAAGSQIAANIFLDETKKAVVAAAVTQIKVGTAAPLAIDVPSVTATVNALVQRLANDMGPTANIIHPITGQPVKAVAVPIVPGT